MIGEGEMRLSLRHKSQEVAVLGDMFELGAHGPEEHRRVGEEAASLGIDYVLTVGPLTHHLHAAATGTFAGTPSLMIPRVCRFRRHSPATVTRSLQSACGRPKRREGAVLLPRHAPVRSPGDVSVGIVRGTPTPTRNSRL